MAVTCTDEFFALGKAEAECLGMAGLPIAVVPHPVAKLPPPGVSEIADEAIDQIVHMLEADATALAEECRNRPLPKRGRMRYRSLFEGDFNAPGAPERISGPDSPEALNRVFYQRGWTDGLPFVAPTPDRWDAMLDGRDPDEEIGFIEPRLGLATVGKVAANAVMAGAVPAMMPVILAATRAMTAERLNLKALQSTTHPCGLLTVVHGPIAEELDIASGTNCMGQGVHANAAIGRAVRLVLTNIGGAQPGVLDRATMGTPAKYSYCFAENGEANPWAAFHTERGFGAEQNAVTLCGVEGPHNVNDHYSETAEDVLLTICGTMATPGCNNSYFHGEYLVVIGPEHAEVIAREGWSKEDVERFIIERAIIPRWHIGKAQMALYGQQVPERFVGPDGQDGVRIVSEREQLMVMVSGGAGRHSCVIPSFGSTLSVTEAIRE